MITGFGLSARREFEVGGDSFVFPALINIHDRLSLSHLPRIGAPPGSFYPNRAAWDAALEALPELERHGNIDRADLIALGAYKNLFSGVATVLDDEPRRENPEFLPSLPIRVLAAERGRPFVVRIEEGFDAESQDGIGALERAGRLDESAILVHCLGFSDEDIRKVKRSGASVAWCPASNKLLFNTTCKVRKMLRAGINVALGTDSSAAGSINILDEMRFARSLYRGMYGEDLPAKTVFDMATVNAAKALRLGSLAGILEPGASADIAVFRAKAEDPYESLCRSVCADLELLVVGGRPLLGLESRYASLFDGETDCTRIEMGGRGIIVAGKPAALRARARAGFRAELPYLPFDA